MPILGLAHHTIKCIAEVVGHYNYTQSAFYNIEPDQ